MTLEAATQDTRFGSECNQEFVGTCQEVVVGDGWRRCDEMRREKRGGEERYCEMGSCLC